VGALELKVFELSSKVAALEALTSKRGDWLFELSSKVAALEALRLSSKVAALEAQVAALEETLATSLHNTWKSAAG